MTVLMCCIILSRVTKFSCLERRELWVVIHSPVFTRDIKGMYGVNNWGSSVCFSSNETITYQGF